MMKKVLLHTIFPDALNGPNTVNKMIRESALLKENYIIEDINQTTLPHKNPIKFWKLIRSLKRDIASRKADAIIVTGLQFAGFCCTLAARLAGVKHIIVCVHGYSGDAQGISRPMRWLYNHIIEPWTIKMCHCIYAVCDYGAGREMMKKYAKGKLYGTIHNCFPTPSQTPEHGFRAEVGIPENAVVLTSVGRVVADKGHREIIEATRRGLRIVWSGTSSPTPMKENSP